MRSANKLGARFVTVIGDDELASGTLKLKEMASGEQTPLPGIDAVVEKLRERRGEGAGGVDLNT